MSSSRGEHDSPPLAPAGPSGEDADEPALHDSTAPGEVALEIETEQYSREQQVMLSISEILIAVPNCSRLYC